MKKLLAPIGGFLGIIGVIFGAYFYLDERFAKCADLKQLEQRLDYKITQDQHDAIQKRIWLIKDRSGEKPKDATVKEELRKLEEDKARIQKKLDALEKK